MIWFESPDVNQAAKDLEGLDQVGSGVFLSTFELKEEVNELIDNKGLQRFVINPLDQPPQSGDYLSVMESNLQMIRSIVTGAVKTDSPN